MFTVRIFFCLVFFLLQLFCLLKVRLINSEAAGIHKKNTGLSNPELENFGNDRDEGTLQINKLLLGTEEQPNDTAPLANGSSKDEKKNYKVLKDAYEEEIAVIKEKRNNANNVWCHLVLTLDATTLQRILSLFSSPKSNHHLDCKIRFLL